MRIWLGTLVRTGADGAHRAPSSDPIPDESRDESTQPQRQYQEVSTTVMTSKHECNESKMFERDWLLLEFRSSKAVLKQERLPRVMGGAERQNFPRREGEILIFGEE